MLNISFNTPSINFNGYNSIFLNIPNKKVSLKDYIENDYKLSLEISNKKDCNKKREILMLNTIISYEITNKCIDQITTNELIILLKQIKVDRNISDATVNRYRAKLSHIYNTAIDMDLLSKNPVSKIKKNSEKCRGLYLTDNQCSIILRESKKVRNKEFYLIVFFAIYAGLRLGEILSLKVEYIQNNYIYITPKNSKSTKERRVPLNKNLKKELDNYLQVNNIKSGKIFKSKDIRVPFNKMKEILDFKDLRFHDLRRTFATHLKDMGEDIHSISKLLGHSNILTTERYLAVNDNKLFDTVNKLCFN